ncbi:hypothetical protein SNE40_014823 [Patella caerulea]|uniref:Uncharacterized protein n=1 Tax=Patella caerulea TaxID=87958 RepID=A0AAN8PR41_PATCE
MNSISEIILTVTVLAVFGIVVQVKGNVCLKPDFYQNLTIREKLIGEATIFYQARGLLDCYRQCGFYSLCQSVNYDVKTGQCELFASNESHTEYAVNGIVMNVTNRYGQLLGSCENHACSNNEVCQVEGKQHSCVVVGCHGNPDITNINITSFEAKSLWYFDEIVLYACEAGYHPSINATCSTNGTWSPFKCVPFARCNQRSVCENSSAEGEYWFYVRSLKSWIKSYCRSTLSGGFITLNEMNTFSTPAYKKDPDTCMQTDFVAPDIGYTDFQRIRVNMVDKQLAVNLFLFSNSTYNRQTFGRAGDCVDNDVNDTASDCELTGRFVINTNGTGIRIKSSVTWETWGVGGRVGNITRSQDGNLIEGYCGSVVGCGGCQPTALYFEADPNYTPPSDSATFIKCKALL